MTGALRRQVGLREAGLVALSVLSVLALPLVMVAWIIAFDETGLDGVAPAILFTSVLPGVTVAVVPAAVARHLSDGATALKLGAAIALLGTVLLAYGCSTLDGNVLC